MSDKHVLAVFCLLVGTALPSFAYAQAAATSNTAITPDGTPNPNPPTTLPSTSHQADSTDPDIPTLKAGNLFSPKTGHSLSYWDGLVGHLTVEAGISGNPWTRSGRNFGQFYLDRANTVTLNQIMGSISHPITSIGGGYGIGFVAEVMYGSDARFDPTIGMGDGTLTGLYQWAPTQAHIDVHTPWIFRHGIDFQAGQMYALIGAEGTPALARPFYSFNYASDYIVPFETVGIIATMHLSQHMDWILGIDAGNSTTFGQAGNNSRPKGYFGFAWNNLMGGKLNLHAIGHFGPQGNNGASRTSPAGWTSSGLGKAANGLMQYNASFLATYHVNKTLSLMAEALYLHDNASRDDAYGVTSYLSWDIHPSLTLNVRGEIFRDNTGGIINQYPGNMSYTNSLRNRPYFYYGAPPTTYGALTVGVAYRPPFVNSHLGGGVLTVRPEIRLDKSLNGTHPFNQAATVSGAAVNNGTSNMLWFNLDAVLSF
ncbi:MAG: outer membrane beta-barrel protein [Gluconobacter japonicus]|uniref:outer membrane beta-barrel protein n=1 Tax=Gluconobacter japonicus TaxID=376620 RepID=UPI0039E9715B